jgi:hypothetical protein
MSAAPANAESLLSEAYREEAELYRQALTAGSEVLAALQRGDNMENRLQQLLSFLDQVGAIEARVTLVKAQWQEAACKPGPQLKEIMTQVGQLVERLQACIQQAESLARARKSQLEPELDALIRGSQMQRAYGNWR